MAVTRPRVRIRSNGSANGSGPSLHEIYTREYFLSGACEGLREYLGGGVSLVKSRELDRLGVTHGHRFLDLGCGRGEVVDEAVRRGADAVGFDYSNAAVALTSERVGRRAAVVQGDAGAMPFRTGSFDRILLGDVIEHLPGKLTVHAMAEVRRVLVPGGKALIHTSPNTWFISFVRRPLAVVLRMLGHHDVLARFEEYDRLRSPMHPSELNPVSLRRLVRAAGFRGHCWVDRDVLRSGTSDWTSGLAASRVVRLFALVAGSWPFRLLLGNDLYALVNKPDDRRAPRDGR